VYSACGVSVVYSTKRVRPPPVRISAGDDNLLAVSFPIRGRRVQGIGGCRILSWPIVYVFNVAFESPQFLNWNYSLILLYPYVFSALSHYPVLIFPGGTRAAPPGTAIGPSEATYGMQ